ncbi:5'-flap endonuclease [Coniothyrium glycines]
MAGNVYDIVVLSSSPPLIASSPHNALPSPRRQRVAMAPSSPLSFPPFASPKKPTFDASKPSSRGAPVPEGAVRGFATVGSLVRSEHFANLHDDHFAAAQPTRSRRTSLRSVEDTIEPVKRPRKRVSKKDATDQGEKPKPKRSTRKTKAGKEDNVGDSELRRPPTTKSPFFEAEKQPETTASPAADHAPKLTKSGKPRKPRGKKQGTIVEAHDVAQKEKKPRATKQNPTSRTTKAQHEDALLVSAHFQGATSTGDAIVDGQKGEDVTASDVARGKATIWEVPDSPQAKARTSAKLKPQALGEESLDLDEAVSRRRHWTPPQDTVPQSLSVGSSGKENKHIGPATEGAFTNLLSNFAYAHSPLAQKASSSKSTTTKPMAATKRRRLELVEVPNKQSNSRDTSPEKGKAPKKKARTITDLVTGQYAPKEPSPEPEVTLNKFVESRSATTTVPLNDAGLANGDAPEKQPPRSRNRSKSASEKSTAKPRTKKATAKAKVVAETLLSPSSALSRMVKQDILFGTSSQLAMEESPDMIRQLQLALKQSEEDAPGSLSESSNHATRQSLRLWRIAGRREMWSASTRDDDGGLLEHMDDIYIPEPDRTQDIPLLMDGACNDQHPTSPTAFVDIDDIDAVQTIIVSSDLPTPPCAVPGAFEPVDSGAVLQTPHSQIFEDIDNIEQEPPPSNQYANSPDSFVDIDELQTPESVDTRIAAPPLFLPPVPPGEGASPRKQRGRPRKACAAKPPEHIAKGTALQSSSSSSFTTKAIALPPPCTPPKASGRFIDIEEILDSEEEALEAFSPTPPRMKKLHDIAPLPLVTSDGTPVFPVGRTKSANNDAVVDIHRIPTSHLEWANIKHVIFTAITTHIRSISPTTDPKKPTWHEKILMYDPIVLEEFTAYLNSNTTIRAYKRATQKQIKARNQELKLAGEPIMTVEQSGNEVLVVKKELEAYMVQGWCESMSICCIWGEGRGKGGARRGLY